MTTTLKHAGDEEYLEQAATAVLPGEEVLAAGIFGLQDAIYGMMAGGAVANGAGAVLRNLGPVGDVASVAVDVAGIREGKKLVSQASGDMTVGLLVAVTTGRIVVFNWDGEAAGDQKAAFDRATTEVIVKRLGFSKIITFAPTDGSAGLKLHGTTMGMKKQSGPDKLVLHLLSAAAEEG